MPAESAAAALEVAATAPRVRSAMEMFLQEAAESEHRIRHPDEFAEVCRLAGYAVVQKPHRWEVEPA